MAPFNRTNGDTILKGFGPGSRDLLNRIEDNESDWVYSTGDAVSQQLDELFLAVLQIIAETLPDSSNSAS